MQRMLKSSVMGSVARRADGEGLLSANVSEGEL